MSRAKMIGSLVVLFVLTAIIQVGAVAAQEWVLEKGDWDDLVSIVGAIDKRVVTLEEIFQTTDAWCVLSSFEDYHPQTRNKFIDDGLLGFHMLSPLVRVNLETDHYEVRYYDAYRDLYLIEMYSDNCVLIDSYLVEE